MKNAIKIAGVLGWLLLLAGCGTVRPNPDWRIVLYDGENFTGKQCVIESKDVPNLSDWQYNDMTTSLIVYKGNWTLYEHNGYQGLAWQVSDKGGPTGNGKYPTFKEWNGANNAISSVRRGFYP